MDTHLAQATRLPSFDDPVVPIVESAPVQHTEGIPWDIPFYDTWIVFFMVSLSFVVAFLIAITYCVIRILQIRAHEKEVWDHEPPGLAMSMFLEKDTRANTQVAQSPQQSRWDSVVLHARSENENDRRHAIIEADVMLGGLLKERGYEGETIADQLKAVDPATFNTIELAWEAHKIRNKYAHEGSDIPCTSQEARRVVGLYEQVFREFGYIE